MRNYPRSQLIEVVCKDTRSWKEREYYVLDKGSLVSMLSERELLHYFKTIGFASEARTLLALTLNFHGVKINPATREFRGAPVDLPTDSEVPNPNEKYKGRGIRVDGVPIDLMWEMCTYCQSTSCSCELQLTRRMRESGASVWLTDCTLSFPSGAKFSVSKIEGDLVHLLDDSGLPLVVLIEDLQRLTSSGDVVIESFGDSLLKSLHGFISAVTHKV